MPENNFDKVAEASEEYLQMLQDWEMIDAVYGGTRKMREAGERFLPRFEAESVKDYNARLSQTVLFNQFKKACESIVGKVFKKPIVLQTDVPQEIIDWADNIDREGKSLNSFAQQFFLDAVKYGISHFMVDAPRTQAMTREEQRRRGERPYWVNIPAKEIIGWQDDIVNGHRILTQLRRKYTTKVAIDEWNTGTVERVIVYWLENYKNPASAEAYYRVFEKVKEETPSRDGTWMPALDENGEVIEGTLGIGYIPLVTLYTNKTGFMQAQPPLLDLAYKNIEHWQSSSDQRYILKWARFAILYLVGVEQDEGEKILFGPTTPIVTPNPDAKIGFAEHSGTGINAGFQDLETLKEEMAYLSLDPMLRKTGNVTATARALDEASSVSQLASWVQALKNAIDTGLSHMADRARLQTGGSININEDFTMSVADNDVKIVLEAYKDKLIPRKIALEALQRLIPAIGDSLEGYDIDDIVAMINAESRANPAFENLRQQLGANQ